MLPALPISTTFCQPETAVAGADPIHHVEVVHEPSFHPLPIFAPPRQAAGTAAVEPDPIHPVKVIGEAMSLILVVPVPPRRPPDVSLEIASSLGPPAVAHTPVSYASSADGLIWHDGDVLVVPRASQLLREARA